MSTTKKPVIVPIHQEGETPLLSHYRTNVNKYGQTISVPVVDVRDGIAYRLMAMQMEKAGNRSRWINYNEYHKTRKFKDHDTRM